MYSDCGYLLTVLLGLCFATFPVFEGYAQNNALQGRTIVLDPGHGGTAETDTYRVGPSGEREEWINLRVALMLEELLTEKGASVILTRRDDVQVSLQDRAEMAVDADIFLSIHHNATADPDVNFPIVYYHGYASVNRASVELGQHVIRELYEKMFGGEGHISLVSDHTIFPSAGTSVLRGSYGIPGVIAEASFFTNPSEEQRLRDNAYNRREAEAFADALDSWFSAGGHELDIEAVDTVERLEPFPVFQEAERMSPEALAWERNFREGIALFDEKGRENLERAYELFTLSARSFPDSPVAGEAHRYRAKILEILGESEKAALERRRTEEFYIQ